MIFKELPLFTRQVCEITDPSVYEAFQNEFLKNPEKGDVIQHSGGLRKARMQLPGRGKRGSARVIYLYLPRSQHIVLFYLYTKAERENLSSDQLKRLRQAVEIIKQEYPHEKGN
jgi:hypothetical protein